MNYYPLWSPQDVAERFVEALSGGDIDIAARLLAKDVVYTCATRRVVTGRNAVTVMLRRLDQRRSVSEAILLTAPETGGMAQSDRLTVLRYGPLQLRYWVHAQFDVSAGRIVAWRDCVSAPEVAKAAARGAIGVFWMPLAHAHPRPAIR